MTSVAMILTGSNVWTMKDGTPHPTGFWAEEFIKPHRTFTAAGPLRLRYCRAGEVDLLVRLAGLRLRERDPDWGRGRFTGQSRDRVSACGVSAAPAG